MIKTYGERSLTLDIVLRRTFRYIFNIANVRQAITGADRLRWFALTVDLRRNMLLDGETQLGVLVLQLKMPPVSLTFPRAVVDTP